ncbi:solute carrier family 41 member 1 [Rhipicephalus microplus]|uniref:solute carrier family 41 member 1 n=1 Tax=Rhipicephalus microplus TaxID=6941 RepID=UPI002376C512
MAAGQGSTTPREVNPAREHPLERVTPDGLSLGGGVANEGFSRTPSEALFAVVPAASTPDGSLYSESATLLNGQLPRLTTLEGKPRPELLDEKDTACPSNKVALGSSDRPLSPSGAICLDLVADVSADATEEETAITKERLRVVAIQVFVPFLTAGFGTVGAGLVLDAVQQWPAFEHVTELFILVPALLGLKGNLEMTLAARLSTQANLGNMDTAAECAAMAAGNMALIQCQATVVAFLASLFAVLMGYLTESHFDSAQAVMLCASSMVTASVASLLLGSLMVGVVILARKWHLNPDNVATPIAASLGDLTTLALLAGVSSLLFHQINVVWLSPLVVSVFLAGIPIWVYLSKRNPYTREVLCTGWVPVICAMGISSVGGCILDAAVTTYHGLAVFQPVINGVGGNLVAIQSCKLTTLLAQRSKLGSHPSSDAKSCIDPCSAFCGKNSHARTARLLMLMVLPGHLIFVYTIRLLTSGNTVITPMFLACYMTSALIQVALLLYTARCMVYWMWSRRVDPDNAAIPYLTALGDLLGIALLAASFCLLDALGDAASTHPTTTTTTTTTVTPVTVTMPFASTGIFD